MIEIIDNICSNLATLVLPLIGFRLILDYTRILLFKD